MKGETVTLPVATLSGTTSSTGATQEAERCVRAAEVADKGVHERLMVDEVSVQPKSGQEPEHRPQDRRRSSPLMLLSSPHDP